MTTFVNLVRSGAALDLLLRLKRFLCETYNLSVTRCIEYDPYSKERLNEKGIAKPTFTVPFDSFVPEQLVRMNATIDKDTLIRQYADFRRHMRAENVSEILFNDDVSKQKSSPVDHSVGETF